MGFPGGKGGLFRQLINLIPDHRVYIETHLGSGAVLRNKRPAQMSYGVERDAHTLADWQPDAAPGLNLVHDDATAFLRRYSFVGDEFVYADPPYVKSVRRRPRVYRHELDDQAHIELLQVLENVNAKVMISGYGNPIYDERLAHWTRKEFLVGGHGLTHREVVWLNYEPPEVPFDNRYVGDTFRERQRIKRKQERLRSRIESMPVVERDMLRRWLNDTFGTGDSAPSCEVHPLCSNFAG